MYSSSSDVVDVMASGDTGYGFGRASIRTINYYGKRRGYRCVIPFSIEKFKLYSSLFPKEDYRIDSIGRVDISDVYTPYDYPTISSVKNIPGGIEDHPERTLEISYSKLVEKRSGLFYNWRRYWKSSKSIINPSSLSMAIKLREGDLIAWRYHGRIALGLWTTLLGRVKTDNGYYGISLAWNYRKKGELTFCDSIETDLGDIPISSESSPLYGCPFIRFAYLRELELFYSKVIDYRNSLKFYSLQSRFDKVATEGKENDPENSDLKIDYHWAFNIESSMNNILDLIDNYSIVLKNRKW